MSRGALIYLIEDEAGLAEACAEYLADRGFDVRVGHSGEDLDHLMARAGPPDLLILDYGLPGEHGSQILGRLATGKTFPILVASGEGDAMERVISLELGADDFLVKPYELRELAARAAGLLARYGHAERRLVRFETVTVDLTAQQIVLNDRAEALGPGEVALIRAFADRPGQLLSRQDIIELAPADDSEVYDRAIDTRVSRLRRKLATGAIRTVRGHGYVYEPVTGALTAPDIGREE
ncbi:response regulator transcription factor [Oceanicola sp. 22II-s10i]|uniref:response regulator transcription factor n=1 Tax=Oceanicola sp. 22II-s10i TaxID=1317116 RepID=UPI001C3CB4F9|nr:response regulator transcription factor [Oceanicola sp. 22II-s10i]